MAEGTAWPTQESLKRWEGMAGRASVQVGERRREACSGEETACLEACHDRQLLKWSDVFCLRRACLWETYELLEHQAWRKEEGAFRHLANVSCFIKVQTKR